MKPWYRFENAATDPTVADIHIIDFIGGWYDEMSNQYYGARFTVTAKQFVADLAALDSTVKTIRVHINSPGGDVFAAVNIANALREQQQSKGRTVETFVDGLAASAASIVMMAGSTIRIADTALVMIHNPWSWAVGEAKDMQKAAADLDKIRSVIVAAYRWHSSLEVVEIEALMDAETWLDADEAIAKGFATEKVEGLKAAASITPAAVAAGLKVPAQYADRVKGWLAPTETPAPRPVAATTDELLAICDDVALVKDLKAQGATVAQAQARVTADREASAAAQARATEIRALCATAKQEDLADGYIRGQMSPEDVRVHLTTITAKLDRTEIDNGLAPDQGVTGPGNWKQAFARANRRGLTR